MESENMVTKRKISLYKFECNTWGTWYLRRSGNFSQFVVILSILIWHHYFQIQCSKSHNCVQLRWNDFSVPYHYLNELSISKLKYLFILWSCFHFTFSLHTNKSNNQRIWTSPCFFSNTITHSSPGYSL